MTRKVHEGNTKVWFVPATPGIADISAPLLGEISAGTNLSPFIRKDGITVPNTQNMVDNATIEETFDAQSVGSWGGGLTLRLFRDYPTDAAWELVEYGLQGYIVIGRDSAGGIEAGDDVEVYPVEAHEPVPADSATNENQYFTASFAVNATPNKKATVAGAS